MHGKTRNLLFWPFNMTVIPLILWTNARICVYLSFFRSSVLQERNHLNWLFFFSCLFKTHILAKYLKCTFGSYRCRFTAL